MIILLFFIAVGNITGTSLRQLPKEESKSPEEFLAYILNDAQERGINNPLIGLDTFHDSLHLVQNMYFSLWFLKIRDNRSFRMFHRDIEMLEASKKDYFKEYHNDFFEEYRNNFMECDYLINAQEWQGWTKQFQPLESMNILIKDDIDQSTQYVRYYLYSKRGMPQKHDKDDSTG